MHTILFPFYTVAPVLAVPRKNKRRVQRVNRSIIRNRRNRVPARCVYLYFNHRKFVPTTEVVVIIWYSIKPPPYSSMASACGAGGGAMSLDDATRGKGSFRSSPLLLDMISAKCVWFAP